jgi:outer membrane protein assembly factor BamB
MGNIDNQDILYCLEPDTGKEIWKKSYDCPLLDKSHEGGPAATPAVDGQAVYTFSKKGDVYRFDAASGKVIWSALMSAPAQQALQSRRIRIAVVCLAAYVNIGQRP